MTAEPDGRHHLESVLMRESLLDKDVQRATETPVFRMLPHVRVIKLGGGRLSTLAARCIR